MGFFLQQRRNFRRPPSYASPIGCNICNFSIAGILDAARLPPSSQIGVLPCSRLSRSPITEGLPQLNYACPIQLAAPSRASVAHANVAFFAVFGERYRGTFCIKEGRKEGSLSVSESSLSATAILSRLRSVVESSRTDERMLARVVCQSPRAISRGDMYMRRRKRSGRHEGGAEVPGGRGREATR